MFKRLCESQKRNSSIRVGGSVKEKVIDKFIEDNNLKIGSMFYKFLVQAGWYKAMNDVVVYGYTENLSDEYNIIYNTNRVKEEIKGVPGAMPFPKNCYVISQEHDNVSKYANEKRYVFVNEYDQVFMYNYKFIHIFYFTFRDFVDRISCFSSDTFRFFENYYGRNYEEIALASKPQQYQNLVDRINEIHKKEYALNIKLDNLDIAKRIDLTRIRKYESKEEEINFIKMQISVIIDIYLRRNISVDDYKKKEIDAFIEIMKNNSSIEFIETLNDESVLAYFFEFIAEYREAKKAEKRGEVIKTYSFCDKLKEKVAGVKKYEAVKIQNVEIREGFDPNCYTESDFAKIGITGHILSSEEIVELCVKDKDYEYLYNIISSDPIIEIFNKIRRDGTYDYMKALEVVLKAGYDLNKPIVNNFRLATHNQNNFIHKTYALIVACETLFLTQKDKWLGESKTIISNIILEFNLEYLVSYNKINNKLSPFLEIETIDVNIRNEIVPLFVEYGANLNVRDSWSRTPFLAFFTNFFDGAYFEPTLALNYLIEKGAQVDLIMPEFKIGEYLGSDYNEVYKVLDKSNSSKVLPNIYTHFGGNIELVKTLLKNGADINDRDVVGRTLLFNLLLPFLKEEARIKFVEEIIKMGADVNIKDYSEKPLLYSYIDESRYPQLNFVQLLLKYGADINGAYKQEHKTPLDLAMEKNATKILLFLEKKKAKRYDCVSETSMRGTHYTYEYFNEYVNKHLNNINKINNKFRNKDHSAYSIEDMKEDRVYSILSIPYGMYSRGDSIEDIKDFYKSHLKTIFEEYDSISYDRMLRLISMLVLLDIKFPKSIIKSNLIKRPNEKYVRDNTDGLINFLASPTQSSLKFLQEEGSLFFKERHSKLRDFILTKDENFLLDYCKNYLKYNKSADWRSEINLEGYYFNGYWNTESAALLKIFDLDSSKYEKIAEFPKDLYFKNV